MMDSFEFTKIAGAVLSALLIIVGTNLLIDGNLPYPSATVKGGYELPAPGADGASGASGGATAKAKAFDAAAVVAAVGSANAENGEAVFRRCAACHVVDKGAKSTVGPNLWDIVGRARASEADYASKYSEALKSKSGDWTYTDLAEFIHKPLAYLPGTAMKFPGIKDSTDIADLLAYLRTLADTPAPLPQ